MLYTFEDWRFLTAIVAFLLFISILGYATKKASFSLIGTILSLGSLIVHVLRKDVLGEAFFMNMVVDMILLGISMVNLIIIDEIETRRAVIRNVFGKHYKMK